MFEDYIKINEERILNALDTSKGCVYLRDILKNANIESAIKSYFAAEVEWWLYEEQLSRSANKYFDLSDPDLQSSLFELDAYYRKNAKLEIDDLKEIVTSAVRARLNFLIRPRTSLKWFVYRGEQTKPFKEIIKRMDYFSEYKYFYDGLLSWAEANNFTKTSMALLPTSDFGAIIESIDNDAINDMTPEEFISLMEPLFKFFNLEYEGENVLPAEAIVVFMDDKQVMPIADRFRSILLEQGMKYIDRQTFIDTIYQMIEEIESAGFEIDTDAEANMQEQINEDEMIQEDDISEFVESIETNNDEINNSADEYEEMNDDSKDLEENQSYGIDDDGMDLTADFEIEETAEEQIDETDEFVEIDEIVEDLSEEQKDKELTVDTSSLYKRQAFTEEDIDSAAQNEINDILNDIENMEEDFSEEMTEYETSAEFKELEDEFKDEFDRDYEVKGNAYKDELDESINNEIEEEFSENDEDALNLDELEELYGDVTDADLPEEGASIDDEIGASEEEQEIDDFELSLAEAEILVNNSISSTEKTHINQSDELMNEIDTLSRELEEQFGDEFDAPADLNADLPQDAHSSNEWDTASESESEEPETAEEDMDLADFEISEYIDTSEEENISVSDDDEFQEYSENGGIPVEELDEAIEEKDTEFNGEFPEKIREMYEENIPELSLLPDKDVFLIKSGKVSTSMLNAEFIERIQVRKQSDDSNK